MGQETEHSSLVLEYLPVLTKRDFVQRYKRGEFGNAAPTWDTYEEWRTSSRHSGKYHIRSRIAGGKTWYNLSQGAIIAGWSTMLYKGHIDPKNVYFSEMAPHAKGLLQGEVVQTDRGLYLYSTLATLPMREAFAQYGGQHDYGLRALETLKYVMCPNSMEWLNVLLDRYPFHVIEFTSFSCNWGTLPRYNTVIWEVRDY